MHALSVVYDQHLYHDSLLAMLAFLGCLLPLNDCPHLTLCTLFICPGPQLRNLIQDQQDTRQGVECKLRKLRCLLKSKLG